MSKPTSVSKQNWTVTNIEALMEMLASNEGLARQKARESLIALGKPAVPSLTRVLRNSKLDHLRWEAAKCLGSINDTRAIPSLVKALEDSNIDVVWLAAEALRKFKKAAWPPAWFQINHPNAAWRISWINGIDNGNWTG